jgi:hypothetical protein
MNCIEMSRPTILRGGIWLLLIHNGKHTYNLNGETIHRVKYYAVILCFGNVSCVKVHVSFIHLGGIRITKGLNLNNDLVVSRRLLRLAKDVNVPARLVCKVNRLETHPQISIFGHEWQEYILAV